MWRSKPETDPPQDAEKGQSNKKVEDKDKTKGPENMKAVEKRIASQESLGRSLGGSDTSVVIVAPSLAYELYDQKTESERLYPIYQKRLQFVYYCLIGLPVIMAFMVSVVQFATRILPSYLASQRVLERFIFPTPARDGPFCIFNGWVVGILFLFMALYGTALIAYTNDKSWTWCWAPVRFVPVAIILLYITAVLVYHINVMSHLSGILHKTMKDDFKKVNVSKLEFAENLQKTQSYYPCCGVNRFAEWHAYYSLQLNLPEEDSWHAGLCNGTTTPEQIVLHNNQKIVEQLCKVPPTCWESVKRPESGQGKKGKGKGTRNLRQVASQPCYPIERSLALGVSGTLVSTLSIFVIWASFTYLFLWWLLRSAKRDGVDLIPKFRFAQCFSN